MSGMEHLTDEQLYPLFYALIRHKSGEKRISKLTLDASLGKCLNGLPNNRFDRAPGQEDILSADQVRQFVQHAGECKDCMIMLLEDGAAAKRKKTAEDLGREKKKRDSKLRKLTIKFFFSLTYGVGSFIVAKLALEKYHLDQLAKIAKDKQQLKSPFDPTGGLDPLQILALLLIFVAAWGLAECWRIATTLWIDFDKAKRAVPVIGKAWAERSKRKRDEWEEHERKKEQQ